jgi:hypothetical protein
MADPIAHPGPGHNIWGQTGPLATTSSCFHRDGDAA